MAEIKTNGTMRAPLFSEQVALTAQLNEAWAKALKQELEFAQLSPDLKAPTGQGRGLLNLGTGVICVGLFTAAVAALMLTHMPYVILSGVGLATCGVAICGVGVRQQRVESAQLMRHLANAIAKRNRETSTGLRMPK